MSTQRTMQLQISNRVYRLLIFPMFASARLTPTFFGLVQPHRFALPFVTIITTTGDGIMPTDLVHTGEQPGLQVQDIPALTHAQGPQR